MAVRVRMGGGGSPAEPMRQPSTDAWGAWFYFTWTMLLAFFLTAIIMGAVNAVGWLVLTAAMWYGGVCVRDERRVARAVAEMRRDTEAL